MARQNIIEYFTIATTGNATDFGDLQSVRGSGPGALSDGTKGVIGGGQDGDGVDETIDVINIASTGNATNFGDLTQARHSVANCSSTTRGVWAGGVTTTNIMDYVTIASLGNAADFGDLLEAKQGISGASGD